MLRQFEEADLLLGENIEKLRHLYGEDHPNTIMELYQRGQDLSRRGAFAEAERVDRAALLAMRRALGDENRATLDAAVELGDVLVELGRAADALPLIESTLGVQERRFGKDALPTTLTRMSLGHVLTKLGRFAEAERQFLATERALAASHHAVNGGVDRHLAELYEAWELAEPGKGYDAKAREYRAKLPREKEEPTVP